jgi:hypothetical protein
MAVTAQRYDPDADLAALVDHPRNPRHGADELVGRSVDANGWYGAIIAHEPTGYILAGHTRRRVLAARDIHRGAVLWVDCDDRTANRILLADNRTAEKAVWDDADLLAFLRELGEPDWAAAGFTAYDVEELARQLDEFEPTLTDERDDIAEKLITCPECGHTWSA